MLWLIAIGCFVAILFINAHERDKRARRKYEAAMLAGRDQQALVDGIDEMKRLIDAERKKLTSVK